jgi:RNA polymerase subunit RPABC4/transcription elongation factor Spt4
MKEEIYVLAYCEKCKTNTQHSKAKCKICNSKKK